MTSVAPKFAEELRSSGVSLTATYLGSVPVVESISMMVSAMRGQVVTECIQLVAASVGVAEPREINPIVSRVIGEVKEENYLVDLNINSKMIKVIKNNRLVLRHPFTYFSFGAQGQKGTDTETMFGYIAKNKDGTDRRCHVIMSKDVINLMDVLTAAINVNTNDMQAAKATTSNDGFALPAIPLRKQKYNEERCVNNVWLPTVGEDVVKHSWYHGNLSRDDAQSLLTEAGDFLVRQSDHTPGQYVLSGLTTENEHKHLILLDSHGKVRTRDKQFNNISELIDYHMNNGMAVRSEGKDRETSLNLKNPIPHF